MDKYEYKIKSDEIKTLIAQGDYTQAVEIADTIDWRRVKSVMMLCTISDLYKINRRYEDAKNMLLLAYERRPGGRTICYSLCELCIKMEDVVQALKYYKEFVQVAPKDTGRYILQYKIYEAQDVSLEERISVLEEMKKRDYREKWAYELAYLYHRMGLATRCVEECDELILWFGGGKYVVKAMELKMLHQPLTPAQQEIYDRRFEELPEETSQEGGDAGSYEESDDYGQQADMGQEAYGWASEDGQYIGDGQEDGQYGYEGDFRQPEDGLAGQMEGLAPGEPDEGASSSADDMDIHVKTMDVGKYNTINLQAELAAGLQEVLGAEETSSFVQGTEGQPGTDRHQEQEGYEDFVPEEMEESEVFFGGTGEMEDLPWETGEEPGEEADLAGAARMQNEEIRDADVEGAGLTEWGPGGALPSEPEPDALGGKQPWETTGQQGNALNFEKLQREGADFAKRQPEAAEAAEGQIRERQQGEAEMAQRRDVIDFAERQLAVERQRGAANAAVQQPVGQLSAADVTGRQVLKAQAPGAADLPVRPEPQESSPADETAVQVMEQLRSEAEQSESGQNSNAPLPRELAEVLSQEANGQISLVLPESAAIEKQITGQMKIDDILIEWERMKKENEEKRREEVRRHILHQTGPMFTEFEAAIRDGLLEKLEKENEDKGAGTRKEQASAGEERKPVQSQAESGEDKAAGAPSEDNIHTVPEKGARQTETGFGDGVSPEYESAFGDGAEAPEEPGFQAGVEDTEKSGHGEEPDSENRPEYIEDGNFEGITPYEDVKADGNEDRADFEEEPVYKEEAGYRKDSGYREEAGYGEDTDYREEAGYGEDSDYREEAGYREDSGYREEAGYGEDTDYREEADYGEDTDYREETGYGEDSDYREEADYRDDSGYREEAGYEEDSGQEDGLSYGEKGYEEAPGYEEGMNEGEDAWEAESYEAGDEIQEADIIEEIEGQQEQAQKTNKRPKPARLKTQTDGKASEKGEEQPIERDQAKVRSLSREEKELFAPFIQNRHSKEQLIKAIDSLSMAAYTGNLIITGEEGMDMLTLAKNIIRDVRVTDRNFSGKVARITGQGLNDRKMEETLEQLNNGALIIETASGMSRETAAKLHRSLQQERVGIIVIMEDTKKAMKKLLLGTPELYGDFPARIDLEALSNDTLVSFGKQYAREMEYAIDDLGMLALHTRIEELQTIDHVVTVAEVKQIVDEAIHHASRKTLGHFFDVLLARRYDDEDMVILTEKDFVA